jgi:hypothetical protein
LVLSFELKATAKHNPVSATFAKNHGFGGQAQSTHVSAVALAKAERTHVCAEASAKE